MGKLARLWENRDLIWEQLGMEAEFVFQLFPLNMLGSDVVPRLVRYAGYRAYGAKIETPNIFGSLTISGDPRKISIGSGSFLNRGVLLESVGNITIGVDVQIGPQAAFITSHHDRTPDGRVSAMARPRDIVVGDRCWIGARAIILPGVTLAPDVVVAAGAVVAKDCDVAGGTYAGVPAKLIKEPVSGYVTVPTKRGVS